MRSLAELREQRIPYVHAVVVLAERPTSARPGDEAIVLADGTIDGFVGGDCVEGTVREHAARVLDSGESLLVRITPTPEAAVPGKLVVHNHCLSGGTVEVFLEPRRPAPLLAVVGDSPIARALVEIGRPLGYDIDDSGAIPDGAEAVVVATHGRDEVDLLTTAVRSGAAYVGLIASPARGAGVLAGLDPADAARVVTPAGLDIGARTPGEVAVSIFADVVARRPRRAGSGAAEVVPPAAPCHHGA